MASASATPKRQEAEGEAKELSPLEQRDKDIRDRTEAIILEDQKRLVAERKHWMRHEEEGTSRYSLTEAAEKVEKISEEELEAIDSAFLRFDLDEGGALESMEMRMALRCLGYNTPIKRVEKWCNTKKGGEVDLEMFRELVASGKLGFPILKDVQFKPRVEQLCKRLEHVTSGGRRGALREDMQGKFCHQAFLPGLKDLVPPKFGSGQNRFEGLNAELQREMREAFLFVDTDKSGFLEAEELRDALVALGLHFDDSAIARYIETNGGSANENLYDTHVSAQLYHRQQMLHVYRTLLGGTASAADDVSDMSEEEEEDAGCTKKEMRKKRKAMRKQAYVFQRRMGPTTKNLKWRWLLFTSHHTVGKYGIGIRLYFDLMVVLAIGLGVMAFMSMPFLDRCQSTKVLHPTVARMDGRTQLSIFAKNSVANLEKVNEEDAAYFAMQDTMGTGLLLVLLIAYRKLLIPWVRYRLSNKRLSDLAVVVSRLPRDLGDYHLEYHRLITDHFAEITWIYAGDDDDVEDHPVKEVTMIRDYQGDVAGVLEQVALLKEERAIDALMDLVRGEASKIENSHFDVNSELRHTVRPGEKHAHDVFHESWEHHQAKKFEKRFLALQLERDHLEEKMLEIETDRSAHADMQEHERDVLGCYVVFWCERARDDILSRYRCTNSRCCRCCMRQRYRFNPLKHENKDEDELDSENDYYEYSGGIKFKVKPAGDPSLILWENVDYSGILACLWRTRRFVSDFSSFTCIIFCGLFLMLFYGLIWEWLLFPLQIPQEGFVWVVANMTPPIANSAGPSQDTCWHVCELQFFSDEGCKEPLPFDNVLSSNGLGPFEDPGLKNVGDHNLVDGTVCRRDWRPDSCWKPINFNDFSEGEGCGVAPTGGGRLLQEVEQAQHDVDQRSTFREDFKNLQHGGQKDDAAMDPPHDIFPHEVGDMLPPADPELLAQAPSPSTENEILWDGAVGRRLPPDFLSNFPPNHCYWPGVDGGPYNKSVVELRVTWQDRMRSRNSFGSVRTQSSAAIEEMVAAAPAILSRTVVGRTFTFAIPSGASTTSPNLPADTCLDKPDAVSQFTSWLGIAGPDAKLLRTCRDLARFGILGVPVCSLVPQQWRCLCPETCNCPCHNRSAPITIPPPPCNCSAPLPNTREENILGNTTTISPTGRPAILVVWEMIFNTCIGDGQTLVNYKCGNLLEGMTTFSNTYNNLMKQDRAWPIWFTAGVPRNQECTVGTPCPVDTFYCLSPVGTYICAPMCDAVQDCANGLDEIWCKQSCGATEARCKNGMGRCVDKDLGYQPCAECTAASTDPNCALIQLSTGRGLANTYANVECDRVGLQAWLNNNKECDPFNLADYNPCQCLANRRTPDLRGPLGCLQRGDLVGALRLEPGLQAYYPLDTISARKSPNLLDADNYGLTCAGPEGNSSACATSDKNNIVAMVTQSEEFAGGEWMTTSNFPAAAANTVAQSFEAWIKPSCSSCAFAQMPNKGMLFLDSAGKVGVKPTFKAEADALSGGNAVNDGEWHFVAHSVSLASGEILIVDGEVVANRTTAEVTAAGWTQFANAVVVGAAPLSEPSMSSFSGFMDEVAVFNTELPVEKMRHHMYAATWRGTGPTFLERYERLPCKDAREAAAMATPTVCNQTVQSWFQNQVGCRQGDVCRCLEGLEKTYGRDVLSCKINCRNNARTLLSLMELRCSDEEAMSRLCISQEDCDTMYPRQTDKWVCNLQTSRCELSSVYLSSAHYLQGEFCIARNQSARQLEGARLFHFTASMLNQNVTEFEQISTAPGCPWHRYELENEGLANVFFAHAGLVANDTLKRPPRKPPTNKTNGIDDIVIDADGLFSYVTARETITFRTPLNTHKDAITQLSTLADSISVRGGQWTPIEPNSTKMEHMPTLNPPWMDMRNPPRTHWDRTVQYAIYDRPKVETLQSEDIELCLATQLECEEGVCVDCPAGDCMCDGIQHCPNGDDENHSATITNTSEICQSWASDPAPTPSAPCRGYPGIECGQTGNETNIVCVAAGERCDGVEHCADGQDEKDCPAIRTPLTENATTWVGAIFYTEVEVKCARVYQPIDNPSLNLRLFRCSKNALVHRGNKKPLDDPAAGCVAMGYGVGTAPDRTEEVPPWGNTVKDHTSFDLIQNTTVCPLGPLLRDWELIGYGAALLAEQLTNNTDPIVKCFCWQRLEIEPETWMKLDDDDDRAKLCTKQITPLKWAENKIWLQFFMVCIMNEFFTYNIRWQISKAKHESYTVQGKDHFRTLVKRLLINSAIIPGFYNCYLPTRQWHAFIGSSLTMMLCFRIFWPHGYELMKIPLRACCRRWKSRKVMTQETMNDLYTNPQFELAEGYAELTATVFYALTFSPAIPALNAIAAAAMVCRYLCDWVVFLRGSSRPPFYDEQLVITTINWLLVGVGLHATTLMITFCDQAFFPVYDKENCAVALDDIQGLRDEDRRSIGEIVPRVIKNLVWDKCTSTAVWWRPFLLACSAFGSVFALPWIPEIGHCYCCCMRKRTGKRYDDVVEKRAELGLVTSYQPRQHPRYQSAFKLLDLAAKQETTSSDSSSNVSSVMSDEIDMYTERTFVEPDVIGKEFGEEGGADAAATQNEAEKNDNAGEALLNERRGSGASNSGKKKVKLQEGRQSLE